MKKFLKEILLTTVGTVLSGFAIGSFLLPNKLSSGGFARYSYDILLFFKLECWYNCIFT